MNQIVLDLETQKGFDEVGGRQNLSDLGVSLAGTYFYASDQYQAFEEPELTKLEALLSQAERVIGFNIRRFDFPVLQPYCKNLRLSELPIFDILEEIEKRVGHRVSLNSVAQATLGVGKSGSGLDALVYFRAGEMEKLKKYCLEDVRLTREIYEFGKRFQKIYFTAREGGKREVAVDWQDPQPPANLSLF